MSKTKYLRGEITFNVEDKLDMELYKYLLEQSKVIGKSNYLKQLLYNDMAKGEK